MVYVGPYVLGKTLGRGNYGVVKQAINRDTGKAYAIKIVKTDVVVEDKPESDIQLEIRIMKALDHKNIVSLIDVMTSPKRFFMVMELVEDGELFDFIVDNGKQDEPAARKYFQQLIDAVHYCHHRGVYHRDLKPENLLLDKDGVLKITDFGFSALRNFGAHMLTTNCGSLHYCAPEVWNGAQESYDGRKNDAWSCGVILYVMLTGKQPFFDEDEDKLQDIIESGKVDYPDFLSEDAKDLMKHLLELDPRRRYSLSSIKKHSWYQPGYDIDNDPLMRKL